MKENKALTKTDITKTPQACGLTGTFAKVNFGEDEQIQAWVDLGRLKENYSQATLTNFMLVEKLDRTKNGKLFKNWGFETWEEFIGKTFPFSVDTADRMIKDLRDFGRGFFDLQDVIRISRQAFRMVNPEFSERGEIIVGGESYALTKANAEAIQVAFQQQQEELRRKSAEASDLKSDLDKSRAEKSYAKNQIIELTRKLREAQSPTAFADADDDHRVMLRVQSGWDAHLMLLNKLRERELSPENEARYIGLMEYVYRSLMQVTDDARYAWGRGGNVSDPADALALNNLPDTSRNLVQEYVDVKGKGNK